MNANSHISSRQISLWQSTSYIARISLLALIIGLTLASWNAETSNGAPQPSFSVSQERQEDSSNTQSDTQVVYVLTFEGPITPVFERYLLGGINQAISAGAEAVIVRLDTPGGNVEVTKSIMQEMLVSPIPIVIYVSPTGSHAGSAGTFITLAAHTAAMAPGTSIGAASPVAQGGAEIGETLEAKVKNILSADIENLAARRGEEATEWAIAAVQDAAAATADQALTIGVIDFISPNMPDLLQQMDGFEVTVQGNPKVLHTANATVQEIELTFLERILNLVSDPTIASILLSLGIAGLIVEIRTPGFGFPGIIGAVCLLLAYFGLGQLDADFTGLILIALAIGLFIAEAFTPTFGVLGIGGAIAFLVGAVLLFNSSIAPIPWPTLIFLSVAMAAFVIFAGRKAIAAQSNPIVTGGEALIGQMATAKAPFNADEEGSVFVAGEWWNARLADGELEKDETAEITGRDGYTLLVKRAPTANRPPQTENGTDIEQTHSA